jgi:hypothetical protein
MRRRKLCEGGSYELRDRARRDFRVLRHDDDAVADVEAGPVRLRPPLPVDQPAALPNPHAASAGGVLVHPCHGLQSQHERVRAAAAMALGLDGEVELLDERKAGQG